MGKVKNLVSMLFCVAMFNFGSKASVVEQEAGITMRLIGHEILLSVGDSTSKVLPVKREKNRFQISFEREFTLDPGSMEMSIKTVMLETGFSENYIVEIQQCGNSQIVHSFEVNDTNTGMLPCSSRGQSEECYQVFITDLDGTFYAEETKETQSNAFFLWMLPLALLLTGAGAYLNKTGLKPLPEHIIALGEYLFDEKAMTLQHDEEKVELTGKESELLLVLYKSANETLERDTLLNKVWGDEGDYVGRTLDVFISKLRKKLELDANVKIANVRGVGYKLILSVNS
ncbi:MAG: winged helix-turn-helix domain-containing protein [Flavobacteriales bacterium]